MGVKRREVMKRLLGVCVLSVLFMIQVAYATPPGNQANWTLTFSDEFDGTTLDSTKWATTLSDGGREEGGTSTWVDGASYHVVSNGTLKLVCSNQNNCGMISGHNGFNQIYGYFEASMKLPKGQGMWPAFWLMPKSSNNSWLWPPEIDIMENLGANTNLVYMTNHYSSNYPGTGGSNLSEGGTYSGPDYSAGFHTFAVLWDSTQIVWYIDNVQRYKVTDHVPIAGHGFPGMYIILNNSTGSNLWGGPPDSSTVFPNQLEIEYVRVYQAVSTPPSSAPSAPIGLHVVQP
jgi:beta-glucanase (GH16 family)